MLNKISFLSFSSIKFGKLQEYDLQDQLIFMHSIELHLDVEQCIFHYCPYCLVSMLQKFPAFLLNSARLTLDSFQVVGDELLVSNPKRIKRAIQEVACNALVLKVCTNLSVNFLVKAILMLWIRFPSLTDFFLVYGLFKLHTFTARCSSIYSYIHTSTTSQFST